MSVISDDQLFKHADRVKDKVVIITGAANGIGKETALRFAQYQAKVVIGDLDIAGAKSVVSQIQADGGQAVSIKCNVTLWDDLVALFELAISKYGAVDVVVPNAGVTEDGSFDVVIFKDGKPVEPPKRTLEVNLTAVINTVHLAQHYLLINHKPEQLNLKSIVLIGSMASWQGVPKGSMYAASKHAILGLMRSLHIPLEMQGIRISVVHPFFADTSIVPIPVKLFLAGIPLTPVPRIAGAIFYSATDPDTATNGCAWLLPDDGPVFLVPREEFKLGVYKMIDERANSLLAGVKGVVYYSRLLGDLWRITGKPIMILSLGALLAKVAWEKRVLLSTYVPPLN